MTLSRYDPIKNCFVLKDLMPPEIINAFHPDFIKVYMPEFLAGVRADAKRTEAGIALSELPPRQFHMYSKAGTSNVTPKGKKK